MDSQAGTLSGAQERNNYAINIHIPGSSHLYRWMDELYIHVHALPYSGETLVRFLIWQFWQIQ